MRRCPRCGQTYTDPDVNFCLNDGELLSRLGESRPASPLEDDSPPTLLMDPPRITNQTQWPAAETPTLYQAPRGLSQAVPGAMSQYDKPDQTLAVVSLGLGLGSLVFVCCYGGFWLGLPAAVVGFLAMRNADSDPTRYTGRGMAIAGMVLGVVTFILAIIFVIAAALA